MNKVLLLIMVASTVQVFSMDATSSTADARDRRTGSALGGGGGAGTSEPPPEFDGARASLPSLAPGFDKNINEITRFLKMF